MYISGPAATSAGRTIALMDRQANAELLKLAPGAYEYPRVSPDGKHVAFGTDDGKDAIVWVYDLAATSSMRRLTFEGKNRFPVWSRNGERVAFQSDREGDLGLFWQKADGSEPAERLTTADKGSAHIPESWSPKGDTLLFSATKDSVASLHALVLPGGKPAPVAGIRSSNNNIAATFSPDGRWVAYTTNDSGLTGDNNVFVQPFPPTGTKYQISKQGENGHLPLWTPDGKELFYVPGIGQLAVVTITPYPTFSFSEPVPAPRRFPSAAPTNPRAFDITPNGRLVAVVTAGLIPSSSGSTTEVRVVLNWFEELKQRVPTQ